MHMRHSHCHKQFLRSFTLNASLLAKATVTAHAQIILAAVTLHPSLLVSCILTDIRGYGFFC